jgi:hypothetical protein
VSASNSEPESGLVEIAGLRLRFHREDPIMRVTDADNDEQWVGNVFGFTLDGGPFFNPNFTDYRDRLGEHPADRKGWEARREICKHAKEIRDA